MSEQTPDEYTDLEQQHIDELVKRIQRKHSAPRINNLYPVYRDMVIDLQHNCKVRSSLHKRVVAIGALKKIFSSTDPDNIKLIEHHEQTIDHLLHQPRIIQRKEDSCERCRNSCIIL